MMSKSTKSHKEFVNDFVNAALRSHNINEPTSIEIKHRFDNLVSTTYPYKNIYDDIKTKQSLVEIATNPLQQMLSFDSLDQGELEKLLVLQSIAKPETQAPIIRYQPDVMVTKQPIKRQKRGPRVPGGLKGLQVSSSSLHYSATAAGDEDDYADMDISTNSHDDDLDMQPVGIYPTRPLGPSSSSRKKPTRPRITVAVLTLHPQLYIISIKFTTPKWSKSLLIFGNWIYGPVNSAYFGRINEMNYRDFGLSHFEGGEFNNLIYIKEKMDSKAYFNYTDFIGDFELIFAQILALYPPSHRAVVKTVELQRIFRDKSAI